MDGDRHFCADTGNSVISEADLSVDSDGGMVYWSGGWGKAAVGRWAPGFEQAVVSAYCQRHPVCDSENPMVSFISLDPLLLLRPDTGDENDRSEFTVLRFYDDGTCCRHNSLWDACGVPSPPPDAPTALSLRADAGGPLLVYTSATGLTVKSVCSYRDLVDALRVYAEALQLDPRNVSVGLPGTTQFSQSNVCRHVALVGANFATARVLLASNGAVVTVSLSDEKSEEPSTQSSLILDRQTMPWRRVDRLSALHPAPPSSSPSILPMHRLRNAAITTDMRRQVEHALRVGDIRCTRLPHAFMYVGFVKDDDRLCYSLLVAPDDSLGAVIVPLEVRVSCLRASARGAACFACPWMPRVRLLMDMPPTADTVRSVVLTACTMCSVLSRRVWHAIAVVLETLLGNGRNDEIYCRLDRADEALLTLPANLRGAAAVLRVHHETAPVSGLIVVKCDGEVYLQQLSSHAVMRIPDGVHPSWTGQPTTRTGAFMEQMLAHNVANGTGTVRAAVPLAMNFPTKRQRTDSYDDNSGTATIFNDPGQDTLVEYHQPTMPTHGEETQSMDDDYGMVSIVTDAETVGGGGGGRLRIRPIRITGRPRAL